LLEWLERRELLTTAAPYLLNQTQETATPQSNPGSSGYTPSQISQAYGFNKISFANGTIKGDGSGQTIAIVSAFDDPNIAHDLAAFDMQFSLPTASLSVVNQIGGTVLPMADPSGNWEQEDALDVEWAHAMAPGASLVLVEASSDSMSDLITAARTAAALPGVSVVSMSWGDAEFANEVNYDGFFTTPAGHTPVTFVASSGDSGAPPIYPATSRNVLAVGGTTLTLDSQGNYMSETAWSGSGGGISAYEAQPSYQKTLVNQSTTMRTSPDVAYDANSATGFAVYDSYQTATGAGSWIDIAGTSAGAPQWAALIAIANQGRVLANEGTLDGPSQTLPAIYQMPITNFHDIVSGSSTGNPNYSAAPGYDLVTGRGSPNADKVVAYLVNGSGSPLNSPPSSPGGPPSSPSGPPGSGPSQGSNIIQDSGFELPGVGATQPFGPGGTPWIFQGFAGIAGNGSDLLIANGGAPGGVQVAFIYGQAGSISQTVSLSAGNYILSFVAAQVGAAPGSHEQINVLVGSTTVGIATPGSSYSTFSYTFSVPSAGTYTIELQGISFGNGNAALLDNIWLQPGSSSGQTDSPPSSPSPPPSPVSPPAPTPAPSPPASSSSSGSSTGQPSTSAGQATPNGSDPNFSSVFAALYNLLLDDLLFIQTELNQFFQMNNSASSVQLVPSNITTMPQQQALMALLQEWQYVNQLFAE
jgi:subtilase family serine protease